MPLRQVDAERKRDLANGRQCPSLHRTLGLHLLRFNTHHFISGIHSLLLSKQFLPEHSFPHKTF